MMIIIVVVVVDVKNIIFMQQLNTSNSSYFIYKDKVQNQQHECESKNFRNKE